MTRIWQLQEAKNKLSEVVNRAIREGPQIISRRGVDTVVVIAVKDYEALRPPRVGLLDFFSASPLKGVELELERDSDPGRQVDLAASA